MSASRIVQVLLRSYIAFSVPCLLTYQLLWTDPSPQDAIVICNLILVSVCLFRRIGMPRLVTFLAFGTFYAIYCYMVEAHPAFVAIPYAVLLATYLIRVPDESSTVRQTVLGVVRFFASLVLSSIPFVFPEYTLVANAVLFAIWGWKAGWVVMDTKYDGVRKEKTPA